MAAGCRHRAGLSVFVKARGRDRSLRQRHASTFVIPLDAGLYTSSATKNAVPTDVVMPQMGEWIGHDHQVAEEGRRRSTKGSPLFDFDDKVDAEIPWPVTQEYSRTSVWPKARPSRSIPWWPLCQEIRNLPKWSPAPGSKAEPSRPLSRQNRSRLHPADQALVAPPQGRDGGSRDAADGRVDLRGHDYEVAEEGRRHRAEGRAAVRNLDGQGGRGDSVAGVGCADRNEGWRRRDGNGEYRGGDHRWNGAGVTAVAQGDGRPSRKLWRRATWRTRRGSALRHPGIHAGPAEEGTPEPDSSRETIRSSPLVRRMAREHKLDLRRINGTGSEGRITKEDVRGGREEWRRGPQTRRQTRQRPRLAPMSPAAGDGQARADEPHAQHHCAAHGGEPPHQSARLLRLQGGHDARGADARAVEKPRSSSAMG